MRNKWIRFGCFLTGTNYRILDSCSEMSKKRLLKYTSALLIICLLWMFIGWTFTERYLKGTWLESTAGAIILIFLIIQIERQVILSSKDNHGLKIFRTIIAFAMAMIGTVIIDQIVFKDDINKEKLVMMGKEIDTILPGRERELKQQIHYVDSIILVKENEIKAISDDVMKNPFRTLVEQVVTKDSSGRTMTSISKRKVSNPKVVLIEPIERAIVGLRKEKEKKDSLALTLRPQVEADLKEHVGFLDELEVMASLLMKSSVSLCAWLVWFAFLLGLELFLLVSKMGEEENDYDKRMEQQMQLHYRRMELMNQQALPE